MGELVQERPRSSDLRSVRPAVRRGLARTVRVGGHDVPEQDVFLDPELAEHAMDDRRSRLGRSSACQLTFRRERKAAYPGAPITRRLTDEKQLRSQPTRKIVGQTVPQDCCKRVLVEGHADMRGREPLNEGRALQLGANRVPARVRMCARTDRENRIIR